MKEHKRNTGRFSLRGVTWGLILLALGVIFLLQNLGVLSWGLWGAVWRFWPVVLVLIGLNFLLGGRSPWLMFGITVIVLVGIVIAAVIFESSRTPAVATAFSQPLQGIEKAEVEINFGAGELVIGSLPASSANLVEGSGYPDVKQDFQLQGSTGVMHLSVPGRQPVWIFGGKGLKLETALCPGIPLGLTVKTGASNAQVDLTNLKVKHLEMEVGASRLSLRLPASAGTTSAEVKAGAAQVTITIPQGVAARITADTAVGSLNVDTSRFPKVGDEYQSPEFATATNRVDLRVKTGVASVDIR